MNNVYEAIKKLDSKEEIKELCTLFTDNPERLAIAERILSTLEEDKDVISYFKGLLKHESPSKRRKYNNYDEKLVRFWDALKDGKVEKHDGGQFLELSRDAYYLLGKDEQGSNISTLFIRKCYHHLCNIIFESKKTRWRITGNPGIGKTFFGFYLLYLLSQQRKTVVYHIHSKPPILFSEEGVFSHNVDNINAFKDYLANEEVWYIVDDLLQRAINSVNNELLNFVEDEGEDGEEGDESMEDAEITEVEDNPGEPSTTSKSPAVTRPDKRKGVIRKGRPFYSMSTLEFASDYVSEGVIDKFIKIYKVQLENFVKPGSSMSDFGTLQGALFKQIAHRKLLKGGLFRVRPLFASNVSCFGVNHSKLSIPTRNKQLFSDISGIAPDMYCIPTQKNSTSFDAFVSPGTFFQMTVSESHPIIKSGLEKYIYKDDNSDIKFYFVLPKERYDSYQEQVLYTTKRTVLKSMPPWINRFKQYALEIDLEL
ncbi:putative crinkler family protein [Gigaspora margarita]|uniref:Putative crinkler family protein n=1 Tax=Gigaspora margarita TaxID=4874 RepID=A0A8H4ABR2_GIGMA|nr:putative crinkler family protein [Gigaspora margarita]